MSVFTLPQPDVVFKVIKDRFDYPKTVTHEEVRGKYSLVFRHDRAGRLVDAQEFEHLEFDAARFLGRCGASSRTWRPRPCQFRGDTVRIIGHLYTERRLRPLDMYLRQRGRPGRAPRRSSSTGRCSGTLAATNIFPGDNAAEELRRVTRHGRLIFYDYDELCPADGLQLPDCCRRPRADLEETASEPWYYVGERDIFPRSSARSSGLRRELLATFLKHHEELLRVDFLASHARPPPSRRGRRHLSLPRRRARLSARTGEELEPMTDARGEIITHEAGRMTRARAPDPPVHRRRRHRAATSGARRCACSTRRSRRRTAASARSTGWRCSPARRRSSRPADWLPDETRRGVPEAISWASRGR